MDLPHTPFFFINHTEYFDYIFIPLERYNSKVL